MDRLLPQSITKGDAFGYMLLSLIPMIGTVFFAHLPVKDWSKRSATFATVRAIAALIAIATAVWLLALSQRVDPVSKHVRGGGVGALWTGAFMCVWASATALGVVPLLVDERASRIRAWK